MSSAIVDRSTRAMHTASGSRGLRRIFTRGIAYARKRARLAAGMIFDSALSRSYWPEEQRKTRSRVAADLLWWLLRNGEWNGYYYVYGLDRKHGVRAGDFVPYRKFRSMRNRRNLRRPYNYVCILRDKFLFAQLLTSLGFATPRVHALLVRNGITWLDSGITLPLESLSERPDIVDGFCKKLDGIQGEGAFPLRLGECRITVKGVECSVDELRSKLDGRFLLQERIEQHPVMSSLHPTSVNTVRLITFCEQGKATLFSAALRVGAGGKSVDNWASGGLIVSIDATTGRLRGEGFFKPGYGGRTALHPDSRITFRSFQIPHFQEAVALVTRLHEHLYNVHSIGWDVAISSAGPVIIEGNDDWEGGIPMVLEKDFKERFLRMF
jgi:Sugar-transfer associated ATP-grasp